MIRIPRPDDFHVHVRQGPALDAYVADLAAVFGRGLVMPNTLPPVQTAADVARYRGEILAAARGTGGAAVPGAGAFEPLMSFKITGLGVFSAEADLDTAMAGLKAAGAVAGKLYPAGVTTNSADGVRDLAELYPLFAAMERADLALCVHGEDPDAFCLDREAAYLPRLDRVAAAFPRLRIVLEHVSTARAVDWVGAQGARIAATVTVQHLLFTLDDMLGGHLKPHLFCKPLIKRPEDRAALQAAVLSGSPKFFFGSDSAPHARTAKECDCGAAGVYTSPVALPVLAAWFEEHGKLELLGDFVGRFGAQFYGLPLPAGTVTLEKARWRVPSLLHAGPGLEPGVVPLFAGQELAWRVAAVTPAATDKEMRC
jgi:dihydroorotase